MIRFALPLALLATAGCQYDNPPEAGPPPMQGKCNTDRLATLTGKARSEKVARQALRWSGAKTVRWISPGMAVTMDFRDDRLNLDLDAHDKIVRAHCG
jgi:hypothetical protein